MSEAEAGHDRLLVLAPEGRDASVICALLEEARIPCEEDADGERLFAALRSGEAAGAIITDQAVTRIGLSRLNSAVDAQPPWSDFPFILLTRRGYETRQELRTIEQLLNATLLERPLHPASLVSAARAAIRSRHRQRLAARHLEELEAARGELKALADTLESKVRERTRDLAAANDRLTAEIAEREKAEARLIQAQKMEAVGQLTGGIAHDFNNLLTAVIGSLDLLLRRMDDEAHKKLARNALQAAERGAKVTAQLLAFSRRQRLSPAPVDANLTLATMSDLLARSLGPRIRLETRLENDLWPALVDPTQVEMMILNLAINARDAMPSGGTLTIATSNVAKIPRSLRSELADGEYIRITVTDTGTGMPPQVVSRAFEPFFTTKEPGKGTGLGLSQIYGFARQSGGTARIESREGEGTSVTIYLPRADQSVELAPVPHPGRQRSTEARILIVDDDDDVRIAAAAMVEELGFSVVAAERGVEAIRILGESAFDLVITDVVMPGMNGVELAQRISHLDNPVPVLFATGYADIEEFGEDLAGAVLVRKPFRMADLAARIDEALAGRATRGRRVVEIGEARRGGI